MSKKDQDIENNTNEQEPWEQPIYEESEDDGSRADRRTKAEGKNWYVVILIVLLFLIVLVPTVAILYVNMNSKMNAGKAEAPKTVVVESSSKKEKESSTKETSSSTSTSSSTTSESSSSSSTSSTFADVEVSPNQAQPNQGAQNAGNQQTEQPAAANGESVSVGQGGNVNLYRIAINNGMTVEELLQLNPGIDSQNLQDGQAVRIK
ncbi:MAG: LysM peptidoglycan-binding domain-containing protein [Vagococcus sp.]